MNSERLSASGRALHRRWWDGRAGIFLAILVILVASGIFLWTNIHLMMGYHAECGRVPWGSDDFFYLKWILGFGC